MDTIVLVIFCLWKDCQALIAAMMALLASNFALHAASYSQEQQLKRNFIVSKAGLLYALDGLTLYCDQSQRLYGTF